MDHVELGLNLVTSDVVDRARVFIKDQVFCGRWKPAETQSTECSVHKMLWQKFSDREKLQTSPSTSCIDLFSKQTPESCGPPTQQGHPSHLSGIWRD